MKDPLTPNDLPPLPAQPADLADEIAAEEEEDELIADDAAQLDTNREPELTDEGLANLTEWDEPPGTVGYRVDPIGAEDDTEFARQLVESGADTAETELRDLRAADEAREEADLGAAEESGKTRV